MNAQSLPNTSSLDDFDRLDFAIFITMVKENHPLAKRAEILKKLGEATVLQSRGNFDPILEGEKQIKEYDGLKYYETNQLKFKIPSGYGISLEGGFYNNEGLYLNTQNRLPQEGLFAAGVRVDLLKGSWINDRRATLRKAQAFETQTLAERELMRNEVIYNATLSYLEWVKQQQNFVAIESVIKAAKIRYQGIRKLVIQGDLAAIDSLEAKTVIQDREMILLKTQADLNVSKLRVSNFLWSENGIPLELLENTKAETSFGDQLDLSLIQFGNSSDRFDLENHPKLKALRAKIEVLNIDRKLKINGLLPQLSFNYSLINEQPLNNIPLDFGQYKGGISFKMPLFLRKERGALNLSKLKLKDAYFNFDLEVIKLENKIKELYFKWYNSQKIFQVNADIVVGYRKLLIAEERKFDLGESSLFMINSRELKFLQVLLKQNELAFELLKTKATLLNTLQITDAP
mgnify:FL=1